MCWSPRTACSSGRALGASCARPDTRCAPFRIQTNSWPRSGAHALILCVADIRMPARAGGDGAQAASALRVEDPELRIVLLSQHVELRHCTHLLGQPGFGYLLKDRVLALDEFLAALESVAAGGAAVDPTVVRALVGDSVRASRLDALSSREREVLALAAEGHTNARIADELGCAERTAESHMRAVFQKLDLVDDGLTHRRVLAVLAFLTAQEPG